MSALFKTLQCDPLPAYDVSLCSIIWHSM